MKLIGLRNNTSQTITQNGVVTLGSVYRRFSSAFCPFLPTPTSLSLTRTGIYKVVVNATFTGAAGNVTLALFSNDAPTGASATETITTADTEVRSVSFETYVLVDSTRVLDVPAVLPQVLTLVSTGATSVTITSVTIDAEKVI